VIASSWQRSASTGLTPENTLDEVAIEGVDTGSRLLAAARPVLDELADSLVGSTIGILLADRSGRIVGRRFGHRDVTAVFDHHGALPGRRLDERTSGTNAISTALALQNGIAVHGDEHFLAQLKVFSCYGQPILHPVTGRLEGVLDVTGPASVHAVALAPLARLGAAGIERRLMEGTRLREQELLAAFHTANLRRDVAVVAVGADMVLTNGAAAELLEAADHAALREIAGARLSTTGPSSGRTRLGLVSGRRVEVRTLVSLEDGAVLALTDVTGADVTIVAPPIPAPPVPAPPGPIPPAPTPPVTASAQVTTLGPVTTPGPVDTVTPMPMPMPTTIDLSVLGGAVEAQLRRCVDRHAGVLIGGEPGTGRSTLALAMALAQPPADQPTVPIMMDAATLPLTGPQAWLRDLSGALRRPGPLVLEHVHLLTPVAAAAVTALLEADPRPLIATCLDPGALVAEQARVCSRCTERIVLTPLRYRRSELPAIVTTLAGTRPDGAGVRFSPRALDQLARHRWPGNLAELCAVLDRVLPGPHPGEITPDDLPAWLRAAAPPRPLSPLEQAEHDVIIATLADCGGNKVAAAHRLGISRTTLYQRIRALRIS
jgi:transcriptional regulator of acetoin/glycerol metabolism